MKLSFAVAALLANTTAMKINMESQELSQAQASTAVQLANMLTAQNLQRMLEQNGASCTVEVEEVKEPKEEHEEEEEEHPMRMVCYEEPESEEEDEWEGEHKEEPEDEWEKPKAAKAKAPKAAAKKPEHAAKKEKPEHAAKKERKPAASAGASHRNATANASKPADVGDFSFIQVENNKQLYAYQKKRI